MEASIASIFDHVLSADDRRMIVIGRKPCLMAAVNDGGRAAFFLRVSLSVSQFVRDGQGFTVASTRSGDDDYVQITSKERGVPPLFLKLVEYVLERVSTTDTADDCAQILVRSIDEYRRFVGRRGGRLSEELVRGTFAELMLLRSFLDAGMHRDEAVTAWRGPWAKAGIGMHDFTFADGRGIEVKASRHPLKTVRVSSPSQLIPSDQPLDLLVLPVEDAPDEAGSAISFRAMATEVGERIAAAGPVACEKWESALEVLSLDLRDEWYDQYQFVPGGWRRFRVREDFPGLDVATLPAGIVDIHYSLDLHRIASFAVPYDELFDEMGLP